MPDSCFLDQLMPARMEFCEAAVYCLLKRPSETWTNIGPIIAGLVIMRKEAPGATVRILGWAAVVCGVLSALFHATGTRIGELLDIAGMYLFVSACAAISMARKGWLEERRVASLAVCGMVAGGLLSFASIDAGSPMFILLLAGVAAAELPFVRRGSDRSLLKAIGFLAAAFTAWSLDYWRVACIPENHILSGHGVWHLLASFTFYFTYKHYAARALHRLR